MTARLRGLPRRTVVHEVHRPDPAGFSLDLDINPRPLERARTVDTPSGKKRSFLPARSEEFRGELQWLFHEQGVRKPFTGPLELHALFWRHCRSDTDRGDLDNLVKAVLDAANEVLVVDDRQIVRLCADFVAAGPNVTGRIYLVIFPSNFELSS